MDDLVSHYLDYARPFELDSEDYDQTPESTQVGGQTSQGLGSPSLFSQVPTQEYGVRPSLVS